MCERLPVVVRLFQPKGAFVIYAFHFYIVVLRPTFMYVLVRVTNQQLSFIEPKESLRLCCFVYNILDLAYMMQIQLRSTWIKVVLYTMESTIVEVLLYTVVNLNWGIGLNYRVNLNRGLPLYYRVNHSWGLPLYYRVNFNWGILLYYRVNLKWGLYTV